MATRLIVQLTVVGIGGVAAGGLLVLMAFPNAVPIPWPALMSAAALALWATVRSAMRLQVDR